MSSINRDPAAQAWKSIAGSEGFSAGRTIAAINGDEAHSFDRAIASLAGAESLLEGGHLQDDVDWLSALSLVRVSQESLLPLRQSVFGSIAPMQAGIGSGAGVEPEELLAGLAARNEADARLFRPISSTVAELVGKHKEPVDATSVDDERAGARLSDAVVSLAGARAVITQVIGIIEDEHAGYLLRAALCTIETVGREVDGIGAELGGDRWGIFDPEEDLARVGG